MGKDTLDPIEAAIDALPGDFRIVFMLRAVELLVRRSALRCHRARRVRGHRGQCAFGRVLTAEETSG